MKRILLLLMLLVLYIPYANSITEKENFKVINAQNLFASGSAELDEDVIEDFEDNIIDVLMNTPISDSLVIQITIESSTDNQRLSNNLKMLLESQGYEGSNRGLSELRNEEATILVHKILRRNRIRNYTKDINQVVKFETGSGSENRYVKIMFSLVSIEKIKDKSSIVIVQKIKTDCDSIQEALDLIDADKKLKEYEQFIEDSIACTHGNRYYLEIDEYKAYKSYLKKNSIQDTSYVLMDYVHYNFKDITYMRSETDFLKLAQNSEEYWDRKFIRQSALGLGIMTVGALCFVKGASIHPIYRDHYTNGVLDSDKVNPEYYEAYNKKADKRTRQRRNWYITGGIITAVGSIVVIDAWKYHKFSMQIGGRNGIINLRYTWN